MKLTELHEQYVSAKPFPHIVIDNVLHNLRAEKATSSYPGMADIPWYKYDNVFEKKLAYDKPDEFPPQLQDIFHEFNSPIFVQWLEVLTGIRNLHVDTTNRGAGLHCIPSSGKLDVHADFNIHPQTLMHRRVNAILFLNPDWDETWGGALEFWNKSMTECVQKIYPLFNRLVIFNVTDKSYHGHPEPLKCPENVVRQSMAWYYYTQDRPQEELGDAHSTLYQKRPGDVTNEETETLRAKRAKGRLADMSVEVKRG